MLWLIFLLPVNLLPSLEHLASFLTVHQQVVNFFICHQNSVWFSHLSAFTSFWNKPHPLQVVAEFNLQSGTKRLSVLTSESISHDCFVDSFTPSVIPYVNIFFLFFVKMIQCIIILHDYHLTFATCHLIYQTSWWKDLRLFMIGRCQLSFH